MTDIKKKLLTDRLSLWCTLLALAALVVIFAMASALGSESNAIDDLQNALAIPASLGALGVILGFTGIVSRRSHPVVLIAIILGGAITAFSLSFFMFYRVGVGPPPKADQRACDAVAEISAKLASRSATESQVRSIAETASRAKHPDISAAGTHILDPNTVDYREDVRTIVWTCTNDYPESRFPGWEDG